MLRVKGHILIYMLGLTLVLFLLCVASHAEVLQVKAGQSIQKAIQGAGPGDTIEVGSGLYKENLVVSQRIILKGADTGGGRPVIDVFGNGSAITLTTDSVTLEGFIAKNSLGKRAGGIKVISNNNIIKDNVVKENENGIILINSSNNKIVDNLASNNVGAGISASLHSNGNIIQGNDANHNTFGIFLVECSNNRIEGNEARDNNRGIDINQSSSNQIKANRLEGNIFGIYADYSNGNSFKNNEANGNTFGIFVASSSDENTIEDNEASNNKGPGISIAYRSSNNIIRNNTARKNGDEDLMGIGIWIFDNCSGNSIEDNSLTLNQVGIELMVSCNDNTVAGNNVDQNLEGIFIKNSSSHNMVVGNDVHDNEYKGAYIDKTSRNNIVYNNNIINNKIYNAYCMGVNQWDNGKRGNHYSEFDDDQEGCRDADGNSICDSGYTIPGGSNVDSHPLISWRRDYDA